jgi:CBS domain-containing protein
MLVKEIMSKDPICFSRSTGLERIAAAMLQHDCGSIPIVESEISKRLVGIITDRDIVCRSVALGKNPLEMEADDCMSVAVATVNPDTPIEECAELMERKQVRRIPVVDRDGCCCGVIAQADIAERGSAGLTAEVVREISRGGADGIA